MESNNMVMNRETLLSILKKHLLWLNGDEKNGKQADLSEQDLSGQDFSNISSRCKAFGS